jgi:hypothetical protein
MFLKCCFDKNIIKVILSKNMNMDMSVFSDISFIVPSGSHGISDVCIMDELALGQGHPSGGTTRGDSPQSLNSCGIQKSTTLTR